MKRWVVAQRNLWGDYGDALICGYAKKSEDGRLLIERTGPFLPPISFPRVVACGRPPVVSEAFRDRLASRFPALQFRQAEMARIVRLDWHKWSLDADEPYRYPRNAEPEYYIEGQPDDTETAAAMPNVWEILGPVIEGRLRRVEDPRGGYLDRLRGTIPEIDDEIVMFDDRLLVTDAANEWLVAEVGDWIKSCAVEEVQQVE